MVEGTRGAGPGPRAAAGAGRRLGAEVRQRVALRRARRRVRRPGRHRARVPGRAGDRVRLRQGPVQPDPLAVPAVPRAQLGAARGGRRADPGHRDRRRPVGDAQRRPRPAAPGQLGEQHAGVGVAGARGVHRPHPRRRHRDHPVAELATGGQAAGGPLPDHQQRGRPAHRPAPRPQRRQQLRPGGVGAAPSSRASRWFSVSTATRGQHRRPAARSGCRTPAGRGRAPPARAPGGRRSTSASTGPLPG